MFTVKEEEVVANCDHLSNTYKTTTGWKLTLWRNL
jgi:hypothetical protein